MSVGPPGNVQRSGFSFADLRLMTTLAAMPTTLLSAMPVILVIAGAALLLVWGALRWRPSMVARLGLGSGASGPRPASGQAGELAELGSDIEELAERLAAQLDAKAAKIEKLIAEADLRLAALERAGAPLAEPTPARMSEPRAEPRPARFVAARDLDPDPVSREIFRLADDGRSPAEIAKATNEQIGKIQLILALRGS